jgi:hypothetical protein
VSEAKEIIVGLFRVVSRQPSSTNGAKDYELELLAEVTPIVAPEPPEE